MNTSAVKHCARGSLQISTTAVVGQARTELAWVPAGVDEHAGGEHDRVVPAAD